MSYPHPAAVTFNEMDPHGAETGHGHKGHHIISAFTLRTVLLVLLFFTVLTVGQAQLEQYVVGQFDLVLPRWVNVAVVMAIAVVKGCLVALFFMGLKYDNPMNSVVLCFTLFGFGLFMGFSMGDLHSRDMLYAYKKGEIHKGGMGNITRRINGVEDTVPGQTSLAMHVRENKIKELGARKAQELGLPDGSPDIEKLGLEEFARMQASLSHGDHHDDHAAAFSTPHRSRPRSGLTPGLFDAAAPAAHSDHHGPADQGNDGDHQPARPEDGPAAPASTKTH